MLTVDELAESPRWDAARLAALPGRCRGDLLGPWGDNVARRFGAAAVDRVRHRLAPPLDRIAPVLAAGDWVPACAQPAVTEAIADELLAGDLRAIYPLLVEDTRAAIGRLRVAALRALGPSRALRLGTRDLRAVYDRGTADLELTGRRARIAFRGNALFGHPTWRLLQLFATRALLELAGTPGTAEGEDGGDDAFTTVVAW